MNAEEGSGKFVELQKTDFNNDDSEDDLEIPTVGEELIDGEEENEEILIQSSLQLPSPKQNPVWAYGLLTLATLMVSSAGAVLKLMSDTPPINRSSWRLQATTITLIPGFIYQWRNFERKRDLFTWKKIAIMMISSLMLALHFGVWIASLDMTTLTHSLLFVVCAPIIFVIGMWGFGNKYTTRTIGSKLGCPTVPSWGETIGSIVGFIGMGITVLDVSSDKEATFLGDFVAFLGAVMWVGHLVSGRVLKEMPLFIYLFPVTLLCTLYLILGSIVFEGASFVIAPTGIFGYFTWPTFGYILYLGLGPGLAGHAAINLCLKYVNPLVISVFLLMEPIIGSALGVVIGVSGYPGIWTWIGTPIVLGSTVWVTIAEYKRTQHEEQEKSYA
jgi:drug/metabolite transporter (DMT)-like permease